MFVLQYTQTYILKAFNRHTSNANRSMFSRIIDILQSPNKLL